MVNELLIISGLPGMTDCLKGEELVFAATYTFQPIRVIRISSNNISFLFLLQIKEISGNSIFPYFCLIAHV